MRIHYIPQWLPASFEPVKKPIKPRKYFHSEEAAETQANTGSPRPSDILGDDPNEQHTDILA
jgi:hypothetical protein